MPTSRYQSSAIAFLRVPTSLTENRSLQSEDGYRSAQAACFEVHVRQDYQCKLANDKTGEICRYISCVARPGTWARGSAADAGKEMAEMGRARQFVWFGAMAILALHSVLAVAQGAATGTLEQLLQKQFTLTEVTLDRSGIITAGTQVQLRVSGLWMYSVTAAAAPENLYKNGKIGMGGGQFSKNLFNVMRSDNGLLTPEHNFAEGEKCWVTGIDVLKDGVEFHLLSDPIQGTRYFGNLKIAFPEKNHTPDESSVIALVTEAVTPIAALQPERAEQPESVVPAVTYQDVARHRRLRRPRSRPV
jgi:hypothetical protein